MEFAIGSEIEILNIPSKIKKIAVERAAERKKKKFKFTTTYMNEPVLYPGQVASAKIGIQCLDIPTICTDFQLQCSNAEILAETNKKSVEFDRSGYAELQVSVRTSPDASVLWDRNVVTLTFKAGEEVQSLEVGFAGAKLWKIHGPYWHAWDYKKSKICPFKNEGSICYPCFAAPGNYMQANIIIFFNTLYLYKF